MINYFREILNRFFLLIFSCFLFVGTSYFYKEILLFLFVELYRNTCGAFTDGYTNSSVYFIFTHITEVFYVFISIISFLTVQLLFFCFIYQGFIFLSPALSKKEYYSCSDFLRISLVVWLFSVFAANYALIPLTWKFFFSFQNLTSVNFIFLHFEAKLEDYLNFYMSYYYICIFYFQFFTILFFILSYFNSDKKIIKKFRKLYYYVFVAFSTVISPPDVFSQILISLSVIFLYELLVFIFTFKNVIKQVNS
jgi:sec-independent protein translocase protein TatC